MEKKRASSKNVDKTRKEQFEEVDLSGAGFEEFDVTQETVPEAEASMESLGGLAASESEFKSLSQARDEIEQKYMVDPQEAAMATAEDGTSGLGNIVGVGIGEKTVDGVPTGQLAVKVFVKEKLNFGDVASEALVPELVGGVPTDVDATGEIHARMFTARLRPAPGGVSIGNCLRIMAGTLGCLVRRGNQLFILSNNHVMALVNTSPLGTGIPQPGRLDGGVCNRDVIAKLSQFVPIVFSGQCNFVDCAIAQTSPALVDRRILRPGSVRQPLVAPHVPPILNQQVQKSGRTTQYRRGIIDAVNVTINVSYAPLGGVARFCRQFRVKGIGANFSAPGDSGSLVTTFPRNQPTGLLFAGSNDNSMTFCNDIGAVLGALNVAIVF
jgi:hypothetical protein